jgi:hypothetical protein
MWIILMRLLMKIPLPTAAENPEVNKPGFESELRDLFLSLGAEGRYSNTLDGRRIEYVLVNLKDMSLLAAVAEPVFRLLKVKPEFLPEVVPKPYYGRIGY